MNLDSVPRLRLATVFVFVACAAIGLATTREVFAAVRPAIEAAMIVGLLQQAWELIRWRRSEQRQESNARFTATFAVAWRLVVAAGLAFFIVVSLFGWRNTILSSDRDSLLFYEPMEVIELLLPIIVLANSVRRWQRSDAPASKPPHSWLIFGSIAFLLIAYIVVDGTLTGYLCHKAIAGIEASIPRQFQRPGVYPDHASEGYRSFWLSMAASISVAIGAICLIRASARRDSTSGILYGAVFVACLIAQLLYCHSFYGREFHRVSPEFAGAGFAVQPSDLPTITALLVVVTTAAAYCLNTTTQSVAIVSQNLADELDRRALHETAPCLIVMGLETVAGFGILLFGLFQEILYPVFSAPNLSTSLQVWLDVGLILNPNFLLLSAQLLFVLQLCYIRWRRRRELVQWELPKLSANVFAANWIAVLAAILTGVPTLATFSFLFWLGPFNYSGI